jgi:UDPglucose 6-dehydrogenase
MKVCVTGLWHLGSVTAACLASVGHEVRAHDPEAAVVARLAEGTPPLFEPGLDDLVAAGLASGNLRPTADVAVAVADADVVWVTHDTPVDDEDRPDIEFVVGHVRDLLGLLTPGTVVLLSSQLPVGTAGRLQSEAPEGVGVAVSPENLRLGKAIEVFLQPDRIVVGVADEHARARIGALLEPVTDRIEWMGVASAEMAKHAINAFLAASVTFINEVASICERVGADGAEVERALKSEQRIGPRAYLSPGGAFAGGTLARDVRTLTTVADAEGLSTPLLHGIFESNIAHRQWPRRALAGLLGGDGVGCAEGIAGKTVAVWGMTYKPGTDTLRRSAAVELCQSLVRDGATVRAHDPIVTALPSELEAVELVAEALDAVAGADALVIATEWPQYRDVDPEQVVNAMHTPLVIDANGHLSGAFLSDARVRYASVGRRPS